MPFESSARLRPTSYDFLGHATSTTCPNVLDIDRIREAGVRIGADPLGGASVAYWGEIADRHGLDLTVVNPLVDPTWRFMTLDWDGKIRMDCSSPSAMASLIGRKDEYDIATGNDADSDRHGIVTPDAGLMNPNHFLAVAIGYLFGGARPDWPDSAQIGKTLVSSSMIDRVAASLGKPMVEVPVGFKWFVPGLIDGSFGFGGEESAGASFLRRDGEHLDHRQGRHHPGAARLGDPGRDRAHAERALRRPGGAARRAGVRPHRRPRRPRAEGQARRALAGRRQRHRAGGRADHSPSSPRPRATAPRSAASR